MEPLHHQLYRELRTAILCGTYPAGSRLPATRTLARARSLSRNTVLAAYEQLFLDGLTEAATGSGTRVRRTPLVLERFPLSPAHILQQSGFPLATIPLTDPDGNALYLIHPNP